MRRAAVALLVVALSSCTSERGSDTAEEPTPTVDDRYRWGTAETMPTARTEVAVASLDTEIFVAGGFTADGDATDVVEVFDAAEGTWDQAPRLPEPLHHTGLVTHEGSLYLVGGYRADGRPSARVWSLVPFVTPPGGRPQAGEWRREPDLPTARGALAVAVVDGRIHAVGGASSFGGRSRLAAAHEAFDPARRTWERLDDLPDARDHLAAAGADGKLYVVGGRKLSLESNSSRVDVFDASSQRWSRGPDMPTARGGLAAAAVGGRIFVFGGEQPQGTFGAAEIYDAETKTWSRAPDMPVPRHGLGATVLAESVYLVGGGPEPGLSVSGANEVLEIGERDGA